MRPVIAIGLLLPLLLAGCGERGGTGPAVGPVADDASVTTLSGTRGPDGARGAGTGGGRGGAGGAGVAGGHGGAGGAGGSTDD